MSLHPGRYGIELDAALILIDPLQEVDRALRRSIARNQVAVISVRQRPSRTTDHHEQKSGRIAANNVAEVALLRELSATLTSIKDEGGSEARKLTYGI